MENPDIAQELTRKVVNVLIDLEERKERGLISNDAYLSSINSVFGVASGLTNTLEFDLAETIKGMENGVVYDDSFVDGMFLVKGIGNDCPALSLRISKNKKKAIIRRMNVQEIRFFDIGDDEEIGEFVAKMKKMISSVSVKKGFEVSL